MEENGCEGGVYMLFTDEKIREVVEVVGADNAKPYLEKGWIVLGVVTSYDGNQGMFIYSLGKASLD